MYKKTAFTYTFLCVLFFSNSVFSKEEDSTLKSKTIKALEDQLKCHHKPEPGIAFRAMIQNGFVKISSGYDGVIDLLPTTELLVFGKKVTLISGHQDDLKYPFYHSPGTQPPVFISVYFDSRPYKSTTNSSSEYFDIVFKDLDSALSSIPYKATKNSSIKYGDGVVKITCYDGF